MCRQVSYHPAAGPSGHCWAATRPDGSLSWTLELPAVAPAPEHPSSMEHHLQELAAGSADRSGARLHCHFRGQQ
jgi:hypothetical protein